MVQFLQFQLKLANNDTPSPGKECSVSHSSAAGLQTAAPSLAASGGLRCPQGSQPPGNTVKLNFAAEGTFGELTSVPQAF